MPDTLYVRIKKDYAAAIIKDLQKLDAIELLEEAPIPESQKKEVKKRLKELQKHPSKAVSWNEATKKIKTSKEPTKSQILRGIKQAVKEINLVKAGKLKAKDARELINEL